MKTIRYALIFLSVININSILAQDVIEEIIVISSYIDQDLDSINNPIHIISGNDVSNMATQSIGESIDNLLGVSSADYGAGVGHPVIRGMTGNRVKVICLLYTSPSPRDS